MGIILPRNDCCSEVNTKRRKSPEFEPFVAQGGLYAFKLEEGLKRDLVLGVSALMISNSAFAAGDDFDARGDIGALL